MTSTRSGIAALCLVLAVGACSSERPGALTGAPATSTSPPQPRTPFPVNFVRDIFGPDSATITHPWWPLTPGTQWIWEGTAIEGDEEIERRVVFTATGLTKTIAGVETFVGWDRDFNDGVLSEAELIFLAQDKTGNVWHLGQYREKYDEEGELDGGRAWLVGYLADAKAGIMMKASPAVGDPAYSQGFAPPPYNWDDFGRTFEAGESMCVPVGCYDDVLVIEEFEPTKPGASQLKFYARGVGNIGVGWHGEAETEREEMDLIRLLTLSPTGLEEAHQEAARLEARANVYGLTTPLQRRADASPTGSPAAAATPAPAAAG